jgi:hypothetical protein
MLPPMVNGPVYSAHFRLIHTKKFFFEFCDAKLRAYIRIGIHHTKTLDLYMPKL